ncbi:hypothetical protein SAMN05660923_02882 [Tepidimicrobium xylanilyticum]|uniref:Uncharacterized protein n=1 Tax=Tepidimicrobium xylanilyticum TaxID=1123352 RepID=A0A1H3ED08_9FIRM|nr:hypothetical protein SAMN05660923_02882 [Tepidimicrobium xylanilyticum]
MPEYLPIGPTVREKYNVFLTIMKLKKYTLKDMKITKKFIQANYRKKLK